MRKPDWCAECEAFCFAPGAVACECFRTDIDNDSGTARGCVEIENVDEPFVLGPYNLALCWCWWCWVLRLELHLPACIVEHAHPVWHYENWWWLWRVRLTLLVVDVTIVGQVAKLCQETWRWSRACSFGDCGQRAVGVRLAQHCPEMFADPEFASVRAGAAELECAVACGDVDRIHLGARDACLQRCGRRVRDAYVAAREVVVAAGADVGGEPFRERGWEHQWGSLLIGWV